MPGAVSWFIAGLFLCGMARGRPHAGLGSDHRDARAGEGSGFRAGARRRSVLRCPMGRASAPVERNDVNLS